MILNNYYKIGAIISFLQSIDIRTSGYSQEAIQFIFKYKYLNKKNFGKFLFVLKRQYKKTNKKSPDFELYREIKYLLGEEKTSKFTVKKII